VGERGRENKGERREGGRGEARGEGSEGERRERPHHRKRRKAQAGETGEETGKEWTTTQYRWLQMMGPSKRRTRIRDHLRADRFFPVVGVTSPPCAGDTERERIAMDDRGWTRRTGETSYEMAMQYRSYHSGFMTNRRGRSPFKDPVDLTAAGNMRTRSTRPSSRSPSLPLPLPLYAAHHSTSLVVQFSALAHRTFTVLRPQQRPLHLQKAPTPLHPFPLSSLSLASPRRSSPVE
jgi:hypothetical protein